MMVQYIRADGRRKVGMYAKTTEQKGRELIEKKIVIEYTGHWPPLKTKMKFNLKNLTQWQ